MQLFGLCTALLGAEVVPGNVPLCSAPFMLWEDFQQFAVSLSHCFSVPFGVTMGLFFCSV